MARESGSVQYEEEYISSSRGLKLFTCRWLPANQEPKALVFLCHGYAMESTMTMDDTGRRLAKAGFGAYGIDYEGHGKSAGLAGYVPSFDHIVADCFDHFSQICERSENKSKLRYLLGESMGGAVIIMLHRKNPEYWDGAVLVAPMCKIADDVRPSAVTVSVLTRLTRFIPTWKIIPVKEDIVDVAFRDPAKRQQVRENPLCYKGRPRLMTAYELLRVSTEIENSLLEVSLPFAVLHGGADKVTDIAVSEELYKTASSKDKTFKTYPEMWHSLLFGETLDNTDIVFSDIIGWLDERCYIGNSRLERQQKQSHDTSGKDTAHECI